MEFGLSTYSFYWHLKDENGFTLFDAIEQTAKYKVGRFQICDFERLEQMSDSELFAIATYAEKLGVTLEIGSRGVSIEKLNRFIDIALILKSKMIRMIIHDYSKQYNLEEVVRNIKTICSELERHDIQLTIETYEQIKSAQLVEIIEAIGHPSVGICLDPANCIANLETPNDVINNCMRYVNEVHIKDFKFQRQGGLIGFTLTGTALGKGQLPFREMLQQLNLKNKRRLPYILEFWLPFDHTMEETIVKEKEWLEESIAFWKQVQQSEQNFINKGAIT